eukprot:scaffold117898_cov35-Tisochrysis_lutea.AAC.1
MLDQYEDEYRAHASDALAKVETAESASHQNDRRAAAADAQRSLDAAKEVVELLEMECGALPKTQRSSLSTRVRSYRSELSDLGRRLKTVQRTDSHVASAAAADSIREDLFSGRDSGDQADERSRMLANHDRIAASNDRLRHAHAATIDMEERGAAIMGELAFLLRACAHQSWCGLGVAAICYYYYCLVRLQPRCLRPSEPDHSPPPKATSRGNGRR